MRLLLSTFLLAFLLTSCSSESPANGDDPIEALKASEITERYTPSYWHSALKKRPALFKKAERFCRSHDFDATRYPNCDAMKPALMRKSMQDVKPPAEFDSFSGEWNF